MGEQKITVSDKKVRKISVKMFGFIAVIILFVLLMSFLLLNLNKFRTILSLEKVDSYPLYSLKYYGDYKFDYALKKAVKDSKSAFDERSGSCSGKYMCSSFLAKNERGEPIFCRNLDYTLLNHTIALLKTDAPGKNASISMADLFYLGYGNNNPPSKSLLKPSGLLKAPRVTIDGMNEYGLALAVLSVPFAQPSSDPRKDTIDEVAANRLILDNAKNVDEAIEVIKKYNIQFQEGAAHFMIADAKGKSAVIEFINGKVVSVKKDKPWQVVTNFILSANIGEKTGLDRYNTAFDYLNKKNGKITETEAMELLTQISQAGTVWSIIYNLKTGDVKVVMGKKYNYVKSFKLKMISR